MNLQPLEAPGRYTITGYGDGYVSVNGQRHAKSLIVLPDRVIEGWIETPDDALSAADFERLAELDCETILLGTGTQLRFPDPVLLRPLALAGKGIEVMDTKAACRTYNVLVCEGRRVAAALLVV